MASTRNTNPGSDRREIMARAEARRAGHEFGRRKSGNNLASFLQQRARELQRKTALELADAPDETVTYGELANRSISVAKELIRAGVRSGDRVAILSEGQPAWVTTFFGILHAGAIAVPLDTKLTIDELRNQLNHCGATLLFASDPLAGVAKELPIRCQPLTQVALTMSQAGHRGRASSKLHKSADARPVARAASDPAVITYTSGTTGKPKGVVTSHGNLLFQVHAFRAIKLNSPPVSAVSFLPLNHLFELTAGMLGILFGGGQICYCRQITPEAIVAAMRSSRPNCMVAVPLFLTAVKAAIERRIRQSTLAERIVAQLALRCARWTPVMRLRRSLLFFIHRTWGGRLEFFITGGAPLDPAVAKFFEQLGIRVLEGYGMTETSPVITTNTRRCNRIGSVGRPLPGVQVRCSADGEILTRGPHVMIGYFNEPELTREVIGSDGWLRTGDLGRIDPDGFLHVTGRRKNLIVLACGKKVYPEEIEPVLFNSLAIKEGCIVGCPSPVDVLRGTDEVCAVVVPSERLRESCRDDRAGMIQAIRAELFRNGAAIAPFKRPTRVVVRDEDLPVTATRKIRRNVIHQWLHRRSGVYPS